MPASERRAVDRVGLPGDLHDGLRDGPDLGYDGVEVMVWTDPVSQDTGAARLCPSIYDVPILAIHAPCLLITQRVWGTDPWRKLRARPGRGRKVGAPTVVVHPPFRWQREYARDFVAGIERMADETDVRSRSRTCSRGGPAAGRSRPTCPHWDLADESTTGRDPRPLAHRRVRLGRDRDGDALGDRLAHVHLADGSGRTETSTWSPVAARSRAPSCWSGSRRGGTPARSSWRSTPGAPSTAPSARPTSPRRSRSRGSTSRRPRVRLPRRLMAARPPALRLRRDDYDALRPDYPAPLFDALESASVSRCCGRTCCDVGAGTGIVTARAGRPRSDRDAVDPGEGVMRLLNEVDLTGAAGRRRRQRAAVARRAVRPGDVRTVLPLDRPRSCDRRGVPGAQAGWCATWWNRHDQSVPWFARHQARLFAACGWTGHEDESWVADLLAGPRWRRRVATVDIPWRRRMTLADFGRNIATKSYVFALGDRAAGVVAAELAELEREHPQGFVDEPLSTYAVMARR